ncbi:MAG: acyltransferase 3, partial [Frankiales bacterium]|nr:acyltransferase 3 [Frankiales bacterium]
MKYRPDIDGLRAVAVLAVIAFHLDTRITGGFVGVDVFFVISGYLITQIIAGELAEGRFTITGFYRRRLRRIVPALLVMLLAVSVAAATLLIDTELGALHQSLLAAGLFGSNIFFWRSAAAFTGPGTALLHTWSLGVEEQFYILFPLLLLAGHRFFRARLRLVLALITVGSFLLSAYQVRSGHDSAA